jgi:hypothetical protein
VYDGVAISRNGDIVVALRSGAVQVYGTGTVGIARREPDVSPAAAPAPDVATQSWQPSANAGALPGAPVGLEPAQLSTQSPIQTRTVAIAPASAPQPASFAPACTRSPEEFAQSHPAEKTAAHVTRSMRWQEPRTCLEVASVKASGSSAGVTAANTLDRDLRTRWTPVAAGAQWLVYDLGSGREIDGLSVVWYAPRTVSVAMRVEVSSDGATYTEVDRATLEGRGTQSSLRSFVPSEARFVRVRLDTPAGSARPSVYEVGVHGSLVASVGR